MKRRMKEKKRFIIMAASIALLLIIVGVYLGARGTVDKNNDDTEPTEISTQSNGSGELIGYSISPGENRDDPCNGMSYSRVYSGNIRDKAVTPAYDFVNATVAFVSSKDAQSLALKLSEDVEKVKEEYKFGEITGDAMPSEIERLIVAAEEDIAKLKLQAWNEAMDKAASDFNQKIVNGPEETCFVRYKVTIMKLSDYINLETLRQY